MSEPSTISTLVQRMKEGSLSKQDLFQELARIQRGGQENKVANPPESDEPSQSIAESDNESGPEETMQMTEPDIPMNEEEDVEIIVPPPERVWMDEQVNHSQITQTRTTTTNTSITNQQQYNQNQQFQSQFNGQNQVYFSENGEMIEQRHEQQQQDQQQQQPSQQQQSQQGMKRAKTQSQQQQQQQQSLNTQVLSSDNSLNQSLRSSSHRRSTTTASGFSFAQRAQEWKKQRELENKRLKKEYDQLEIEKCTFKPKINTKKAANVQGDRKGHVTERLFLEAKKKDPVREFSEREKRDSIECTFMPKINKSAFARPVKSRYRSQTPTNRRMERSSHFGESRSSFANSTTKTSSMLRTGEDECTFKPKVNEIKSDMTSAQLYLQTDVVERLSRPGLEASTPSTPSDRSSNGQVMDLNTFMSALEQKMTPSKNRRSRSVPRHRMDDDNSSISSGMNNLNSSTISAEERAARKKSFQEFLLRQKQQEQRKSQNIKELQRKTTASFKPKINVKSDKLVKSAAKGNFLQRVERDVRRKQHDAIKQKVYTGIDPECTFQPQINAKSKKLRPRSVVELSYGDSLKRDTSQRLMRLKAEQEEVRGLTFKPQINNTHVEGKLRISAEPDTYLDRIQNDAKLFSDRQRKSIQEQEMKEFAECTFHPKTHLAPSYVKRIARSMALARAARPPAPKDAKPDWR
eukprot:TRINITY_DN483_c6_g1_i1.p1 TRINITY_DN483_c6_g1~~TRINITY_DN483_c6_g1_i1.p1  ORF type:complete len:690 (-),score=242.83 TRINITY_DN483_c6_g1_i1:175-2244(-)